MNFCPIMSYRHQTSYGVYCLEEKCKFTDEAGDCLIKQALQCYVTKERTRAATEEAFENIFRDISKGSPKEKTFEDALKEI